MGYSKVAGMAPLRVLIRAESPRELANYRELLGHGGDLAPVTDIAQADVILLVVNGSRHSAPALPVGGAPVLALVGEEVSSGALADLEQGGASILSDGVSRDQLQAALRAVATGLSVRDPAVTHHLPRVPQVSAGEHLTPRERELLRFLGEGLSNREIAEALGLTDHTVKFHLRSIFAKLGVRTRTEAVSVAVRRGMLML
jgi:DNA-binding NarL/FixJ family response regulator